MISYTVTVFVNVDEDFHFEELKPTDTIAQVAEFTIEAPDPMAAAGKIWTVGNKMGPDDAGNLYPPDVRSLSVGDLIAVNNWAGREVTFLAVASFGWTEIPEPTNPIVPLEGTIATSRRVS
jgi:hypothetical protein